MQCAKINKVYIYSTKDVIDMNNYKLSIEELKDKRIIPFAQKTIEKRVEQFCKQNNLPVPKKQSSFTKIQPQGRIKYRPK